MSEWGIKRGFFPVGHESKQPGPGCHGYWARLPWPLEGTEQNMLHVMTYETQQT